MTLRFGICERLLISVSVTPNDILYTEGVRLWPSRTTLDHYASVIHHSEFPLFFRNSVIVSTVVSFSVVLFSNQTLFTGLVPRAVPEIGDITFFVGTLLSAGLYVVLARRRIEA